MYPGELAPGVLTGFYQCPDKEHAIHDVLVVGHPAELVIAAKMLVPDAEIHGPDESTGAVEFKGSNGSYLNMRPATPASAFLKNASRQRGDDLPF